MTLLQSQLQRSHLTNILALNGFTYVKSSSVTDGTRYRLVMLYSGKVVGDSKASLEELVEYSNQLS